MNYINFHGQEWNAIRLHLLKLRETKVGMLVGDQDHDTSNQLRGAIKVIDQLLGLEKAAQRAAE